MDIVIDEIHTLPNVSTKIKNGQVIIAISKEDKYKKDSQEYSTVVEEKEVDVISMLKETGLKEFTDYTLNMID